MKESKKLKRTDSFERLVFLRKLTEKIVQQTTQIKDNDRDKDDDKKSKDRRKLIMFNKDNRSGKNKVSRPS